jgi:hypothetical protein
LGSAHRWQPVDRIYITPSIMARISIIRFQTAHDIGWGSRLESIRDYLVIWGKLNSTFRNSGCVAEGVGEPLQQGGRDFDGLRAQVGHG